MNRRLWIGIVLVAAILGAAVVWFYLTWRCCAPPPPSVSPPGPMPVNQAALARPAGIRARSEPGRLAIAPIGALDRGGGRRGGGATTMAMEPVKEPA
jgi:hypothetical protein